MLCLEILYFFGKPPTRKCLFHSFHAIDLLLYLPENIREPAVFWCFQGVQKKKPVLWNGLTEHGMNVLNVELDVLKDFNKEDYFTQFFKVY